LEFGGEPADEESPDDMDCRDGGHDGYSIGGGPDGYSIGGGHGGHSIFDAFGGD
jgi:hypothetical protein